MWEARYSAANANCARSTNLITNVMHITIATSPAPECDSELSEAEMQILNHDVRRIFVMRVMRYSRGGAQQPTRRLAPVKAAP